MVQDHVADRIRALVRHGVDDAQLGSADIGGDLALEHEVLAEHPRLPDLSGDAERTAGDRGLRDRRRDDADPTVHRVLDALVDARWAERVEAAGGEQSAAERAQPLGAVAGREVRRRHADR